MEDQTVADSHANHQRFQSLYKHLHGLSCGLVVRHTQAHIHEYFVLVPCDDAMTCREFLLMRLASAEEMVLPACERDTEVISMENLDEIDQDMVDCLDQIPHEAYNPYSHSSGIVNALMDRMEREIKSVTARATLATSRDQPLALVSAHATTKKRKKRPE